MCRRRGRGAGGARIAIASESKQAGATPPGGAQIILPPASHPRARTRRTRHKSVRRYGDGPGRA